MQNLVKVQSESLISSAQLNSESWTHLIQGAAGGAQQGVRLQHEQLEQFVLDLTKRRCLRSQDDNAQRDDRGEFPDNIADRNRRIIGDLFQGYGFPVLDDEGA